MTNDRDKRLTFALTFLARVEVDASWPWKILWSDEAHFHLSGTVNTHNCHILDTENPRTFQDIPLHSPKVTVWCGFTATFILGPFFFEETTRNGPVTPTVTARRYKNMLENLLHPKCYNTNVLIQLPSCKLERLHTLDSVCSSFFGNILLMIE
ncbi:uncharacterized protein TNCV_1342861 [Trichonephila clavipes]|nr:uncharacterized protein TNCV_1342861 [Trichonephila clavipes]